MGTANRRNPDGPRNLAERREAEELDSIKTFHGFLQGTIPEGVTVRRFKKMNPDQAFTVIWFLQEVCHLLSDHYEMCHNCKVIYDAWGEGHRNEKTGRCFCGSCFDPDLRG